MKEKPISLINLINTAVIKNFRQKTKSSINFSTKQSRIVAPRALIAFQKPQIITIAIVNSITTDIIRVYF